MARDNSLRSYRDFDAYDGSHREPEPVVRSGDNDPLADLVRIMGRDDTYTDMLKAAARTRGEPEDNHGASQDHESGEIDVPAMPLRSSPPTADIDWDDLEAELTQYQQTSGDPAEAAEGLRGSLHEGAGDTATIDDLERLLADEMARDREAERFSGAHDAFSGARGGGTAFAAGAAATGAATALGAAALRMRTGEAASQAGHGSYDYAEAPVRRRRAGVTAVAAVVALALVGGGSVFAYRALTGGGQATGEPRIVRADPAPVRVAAVQPQDGKPVTDRVASGERIVPREERPLSPREQAAQVQTPPAPPRIIPLVPAQTPAAAEAGQPAVRMVNAVPVVNAPPALVPAPAAPAAIQAAPVPVEAPRRVRTVQVGPDGAILNPVPPSRPQAPPAAPAPQQTLSVVPSAPAPAVPPPAAPALSAAESRSAPVPAVRPAQTLRVARAEPAAAAPTASVQPLDLGPQRTASVRPAAPAGATGSTFVQISSHQSEAEARGAFAAAQRRHPMLQGQAPNIRTAEIPGRGTWHRLRVGPFSREQAQSFCQRYKAGGGSCVLN